MLQFSDGVQLIKIQSGGAGVDQSSPGDTTIQVDPKSGSVNVRKHHSDSDGAEFIAIPIVAIVFTFIYLIVKAVMAPFHNKNRMAGQPRSGGGGLTQEEVAVLQKLQRTLSQMESRVEALETILIEQARTEKNYGPKL